MSLNTSYYRLMPSSSTDRRTSRTPHTRQASPELPVSSTLSEDGKGGPPNNGIVLGQYQTRALTWPRPTLAASGIYRLPRAEGRQRRR
jgi:hypothetical protein